MSDPAGLSPLPDKVLLQILIRWKMTDQEKMLWRAAYRQRTRQDEEGLR
jgi:hypothetical protein